MKEFAAGFYKSQAWKRTREAYTKAQGGLCEKCYKKGLIVPGEIVHHKIKLTPANIHDTNVTLDWNNLELVCRECHAEEHGAHKHRYTVDEWGRVKGIERTT